MQSNEVSGLEHIPTGMVLLDTSKAFSYTKCIIHSALQLCHQQIEMYPCFTADTDTSIMPRSHSASPELTQMPCSYGKSFIQSHSNYWSSTSHILLQLIITPTGSSHHTHANLEKKPVRNTGIKPRSHSQRLCHCMSLVFVL